MTEMEGCFENDDADKGLLRREDVVVLMLPKLLEVILVFEV